MTTSSPDTLAAIILMGVSGSGKSTVASALAQRTGLTCADADSFHPQANITKMHAGIPLTDEDRWPWLRAIAAAIDHHAAADGPLIIACSALKRSYRDVLRESTPSFFVHLAAPFDVLEERMQHRTRHFMPASLLKSQFDTLEELDDDEAGAVIDVSAPLDEAVEESVNAVRVHYTE